MATENSPLDGHFIFVPLSAISKLIKSYHTVYQITFLGIYISASKLSISFEDAINNYIRMLYLSPILLGTNACWAAKMEKRFPMQENLRNTDILDESTNDIKAGIDISKEKEFLYKFAKKNPQFSIDVLQWCRVMLMINQINYNYYIMLTAFSFGHKAMEEHPEYKDDPLIAIDTEVMSNMWRAAEKSTPELRARWAMSLGMLSIIGTKQMAETTSIAIKSRMFGAKDDKTLQKILEDEETRKLYDYWTSRRHYERTLAEVEQANKIKAQGMGRRTYISYRFDDDTDFVNEILKGSVQKQVAEAKKKRAAMINNHKKEKVV